MKALYQIFQKQRKALELSIKKTKKCEQDIEGMERQIQEKTQHSFAQQGRIEALEQQREHLQSKHQRELENLALDIQEKKMINQRLNGELSEQNEVKKQMKTRIEEYEDKIKALIKEFEDESKKHIKEVNEIHEYYRAFKSRAQELETRID
jgi:predicted  nucleic acid-binding Zn-ribbon protein